MTSFPKREAITMSDNLTTQQRSYCMSRVRSKDTDIERRVCSALHKRGLRFRKHASRLPGRPDIVFPSSHVAIFIDGDFWHGFRYPAWKDTLSPFWKEKISKNRQRDQRNFRKLRYMGWTVIRLWQHQIEQDASKCVECIISALNNSNSNKGR